MKVIVSAAISLDGYLDDCTSERLKLSSPEDWRAVELLRADFDVILVGGETVRRDNPSLVIRDKELRESRVARGMNPDITKVTITASGRLEPSFKFFREGEGKKIVFASKTSDKTSLERLSEYADIVEEDRLTAQSIVEKLSEYGYKSLMVEGGSRVLTMFFEEGVVDEFRLAVAPMFVGDESAPRLVNGGKFAWNKDNRMKLVKVEQLGDMAVMHYRAK